MKSICAMSFALALAIGLPLAADDEVHWDYENGEEGPEYWGELADEFDMCSRGLNQSPLNIMPDVDADLPEIMFDYSNPSSLEEINTGHAIQEVPQPGNYITVKGRRYELKQYHFHSPSEHQLEGKSYPMEIHLVHQRDDGGYAVLGILFEEGEHNALMDQLPSFRAERGEDPTANLVDHNELIPARRDYYFYNGSLTTPPCTEGVYWAVMKEPIVASPEQIQHYHDLLGFDNNRPVQKANSRMVME